MLRRKFFKTTALAALGVGAQGLQSMASTQQNETKPRLIKPARLRPGATVALIAPSSPPSAEKLAKGISNLTEMGFKIVEGKSLRSQNGFLAGTDAERLEDLHWAFQNPEIEAVWCIRGGYGASRLLPDLDYDLIRRNPKPFIGYSDVTALHLAIHQRCGLVTFHGPVAAAEFPENTLEHLKSVLIQPTAPYPIHVPKQAELKDLDAEYHPFSITSGEATGTLTGGNLALLSALAGTDFAPSFINTIVFLEDVGEQPYRLDRMLTQLLQATDLVHASGIALGVFNDCQPKPGSPSFSLAETLHQRLGHLGIPVLYGLPFGHVNHQATLPYGIKARLDADNGTLVLIEESVV